MATAHTMGGGMDSVRKYGSLALMNKPLEESAGKATANL
jgi:hypothetical protein